MTESCTCGAMGLSEHTALYTLVSAVVIVAMNPFVADSPTG